MILLFVPLNFKDELSIQYRSVIWTPISMILVPENNNLVLKNILFLKWHLHWRENNVVKKYTILLLIYLDFHD
jgi:hypothetical protein